jgi:hypothetical protein
VRWVQDIFHSTVCREAIRVALHSSGTHATCANRAEMGDVSMLDRAHRSDAAEHSL